MVWTEINRLAWAARVMAILFFGWGAFHVHGEGSEQVSLSPMEFEAVFLSKLPSYIKWPKDVSASSTNKLILGILGKDPFDGLLHRLVQGKTVNGRELVVKTLSADEIGSCHILYVPEASMSRWQKVTKGKVVSGILTVGETEAFTKSGGVFRLLVKERKLVINRKNAEAAGLRINSKLLKISIVEK